MREYAVFLREAWHRYHTTGAVAPSSRFLARAMTRHVRCRSQPARILEVGPGTGVFTRQLAALMGPHDELVMVEVSARFVQHLEGLLQSDPQMAKHRGRIRLVHAAIEAAPLEPPFDFILSGLPFNNFPAAQVRLILRTLRRLSRTGTVLSFFEYLWLRPLRIACSSASTRRQLRAVAAAIQSWQKRYGIGTDVVLRNLPPALVRHWRFR